MLKLRSRGRPAGRGGIKEAASSFELRGGSLLCNLATVCNLLPSTFSPGLSQGLLIPLLQRVPEVQEAHLPRKKTHSQSSPWSKRRPRPHPSKIQLRPLLE